ncbi:MAG: hypothetical protein M9944_04410 [Rhizobiaceae bacterium]|nr:hypothetical protein [Rhizobiaceae bacterium]
MMGDSDLRQLELEVEAARAKLTSDIAALRAPGALSSLTEDIKEVVADKRDAFIDEARDRINSTVSGFIENVKEKAVANPMAAVVIGAGIAWHVIRRPPVAIALVGGGLYSLLRTSPGPLIGGGDPFTRARQNLGAQAHDIAEAAGSIGEDVAERTKDAAMGAARKAKDAVASSISRVMPDAEPDLEDYEEEMADAMSAMDERPAPSSSTDKLFLGVAGLAVMTTVALIFSRRNVD